MWDAARLMLASAMAGNGRGERFTQRGGSAAAAELQRGRTRERKGGRRRESVRRVSHLDAKAVEGSLSPRILRHERLMTAAPRRHEKGDGKARQGHRVAAAVALGF